jgi:nitrous oxidase accessory protein
MKHRLPMIPVICLFVALIAGTPAFSATVAVGTCLPNKVTFDSLTDAVQGVPTGSTILVCPGVYTEQIVINKSLTLKGQTAGNSSYAVLVPPVGGLLTNATSLSGSGFYGVGTPFAAQVLIESGANVTITDMAFDATGYNIPTCSAIVVGILIQDASASLTRVAIKNQLETGPFPCSATGAGAGVLAQNDGSNATTVDVRNSTFANAAQSFESDGASNTSTLSNNSFAGNPASNANAISIGNGNSTIQNNTISSFNYPPASANLNGASYGIYLSCVPSGTIANNSISTTQVGIILVNPTCPTTGVSITGNDVSDAQIIGIDVGETNGLVQNNTIRSTQTAIRVPGAAAGNTIQGNTIVDACAAVGSNPAAGVNIFANNTYSNALNLAIVNTTGFCP